MSEQDEEKAQEESMIHLLGGPGPETDPEPEPPQFVDVCMYLADQMQQIVSLPADDPDNDKVSPYAFAYAPADRIAAAQVWLNAAGALHNAQMQERMQMEVLRQSDLLAKAQSGGGLLVPIGMAPPPGIKH